MNVRIVALLAGAALALALWLTSLDTRGPRHVSGPADGATLPRQQSEALHVGRESPDVSTAGKRTEVPDAETFSGTTIQFTLQGNAVSQELDGALAWGFLADQTSPSGLRGARVLHDKVYLALSSEINLSALEVYCRNGLVARAVDSPTHLPVEGSVVVPLSAGGHSFRVVDLETLADLEDFTVERLDQANMLNAVRSPCYLPEQFLGIGLKVSKEGYTAETVEPLRAGGRSETRLLRNGLLIDASPDPLEGVQVHFLSAQTGSWIATRPAAEEGGFHVERQSRSIRLTDQRGRSAEIEGVDFLSERVREVDFRATLASGKGQGAIEIFLAFASPDDRQRFGGRLLLSPLVVAKEGVVHGRFVSLDSIEGAGFQDNVAAFEGQAPPGRWQLKIGQLPFRETVIVRHGELTSHSFEIPRICAIEVEVVDDLGARVGGLLPFSVWQPGYSTRRPERDDFGRPTGSTPIGTRPGGVVHLLEGPAVIRFSKSGYFPLEVEREISATLGQIILTAKRTTRVSVEITGASLQGADVGESATVLGRYYIGDRAVHSPWVSLTGAVTHDASRGRLTWEGLYATDGPTQLDVGQLVPQMRHYLVTGDVIDGEVAIRLDLDE